MEEKERKLKLLLYSLYVLSTYKKIEQPTKSELNSLMLNSIGTIDKEVTNKENLITLCKNILKYKIQIKSISIEDIVEFKIGDVITTGFSSSIISLKFIFEREDSKSNNVIVSVVENDKSKLTIKI